MRTYQSVLKKNVLCAVLINTLTHKNSLHVIRRHILMDMDELEKRVFLGFLSQKWQKHRKDVVFKWLHK